MAPSFRLSARAVADLRVIAEYTQQRWGVGQRNRYLKQLDEAFHWLAEQPGLGRDCSEIRAGYRKHPHGSHVVFYRAGRRDTIEIIRILHKSMDAPTRFLEE